MAISFINKGSGGGSAIKPNVFLQPNEPESKEGIWLQAEGMTFDKIVPDINVIENYNWDNLNSYTPLPYGAYKPSLAAVGKVIYCFGGNGDSRKNQAYKYDTVTDTYTKLTELPISLVGGTALAIGTDIYLLGSESSDSLQSIIKYNTLTDEYTSLSDAPTDYSRAGITNVGTDIYICSPNGSAWSLYKYDTLTDTHNKITSTPVRWLDCSAESIGTDIYLFSDFSNHSSTYKYNTITKAFTKLVNMPFSYSRSCTSVVETDIIIAGSGYSSNKNCYKYNTVTNTYTLLSDTPSSLDGNSRSVIVDNKIYFFHQDKLYVLIAKNKDYTDNAIVIAQGNGIGYNTVLYKDTEKNIDGRLLTYFYDAWHYTSEKGLNTNIPTYYGAGTEWVKFKN